MISLGILGYCAVGVPGHGEGQPNRLTVRKYLRRTPAGQACSSAGLRQSQDCGVAECVTQGTGFRLTFARPCGQPKICIWDLGRRVKA